MRAGIVGEFQWDPKARGNLLDAKVSAAIVKRRG